MYKASAFKTSSTHSFLTGVAFSAEGGLSLAVRPAERLVDGLYVPFRGGRGGTGGGGGSRCATIRFCWFFFSSTFIQWLKFSSKPKSVASERAESINREEQSSYRTFTVFGASGHVTQCKNGYVLEFFIPYLCLRALLKHCC